MSPSAEGSQALHFIFESALQPNFLYGYYLRGEAQFAANEKRKAVDDYRKVVSLYEAQPLADMVEAYQQSKARANGLDG
jgi:hypothetical protein